MPSDNAGIEQMLSTVKEYNKKGFVCHPLSRPDDKGNSPGKKPLLKEWQFLTKTPDNINTYLKKGCNIGLVCGKASGVDAIDFDLDFFKSELLDGTEFKTLSSGHRPGRGHFLFQHDSELFSEKHHFIGIEYFGNNKEGAGSNLVLPPSTHFSGEVYAWENPEVPLAKLPKKLKENLKVLFKREDLLHDYFTKCRHCFTKGSKKYKKDDPRSKGIWDRPDTILVHGMDGRLGVLAIMGELKAVGCPDELLHMACKRFFGKDYTYNQTSEALKHIKPIHPKCETLRQYLNVECEGCIWKPKEIKTVPSKHDDHSLPNHPFVSKERKPEALKFVVLNSSKLVDFPTVTEKGLDGTLSTTDAEWYKKSIRSGAIKAPEKPGVGISKVIIVRGVLEEDPALFKIDVDLGDVVATVVLKESEIFNYSRFRQKCFVACKILLPPMGNQEWERYIEERVQDAEEEIADQDEAPIITDIINHITRAKVIKDRDELLKNNGNCVWENEGCVWVPSKVIENFAKDRDITLRRLSSILSPYTNGTSKRWRIKTGRIYLWPFIRKKIEEKE